MATLVVLQGPDKGRTFRTPDEPAVLGREGEQIPLTDRTVSRRHAEIAPENGAWVLQDLNSANGTYLNGVRIRKSIRLKHGDQIRIGGTVLVYTGEQTLDPIKRVSPPRDLVDLDASAMNLDSVNIANMPSDESVIIADPEVTEAARAWHVMTELTAAIGAIMDPEQLLARVMDVIRDEIPVDHGFILMYDKDGTELVPHVVRYRRGMRATQTQITTSSRIVQHVVQHREAVLCSNAMTDDRFTRDAGQDSIHEFGLKSVICAPIMVRDSLLGIIHIDCAAATGYTHEQLRLMGTIGQMTGLAIQNARLVQQQVQMARLAATGETVAYLSHNMKNVLQAMQSGADLVQMGMKARNWDTLSDGWGIVQRNQARIMEMTMNMLNFSKTREPNLRPTNLNQIISEAVSGLQNKADDRKVMLMVDLEEPFPPIPLDDEGIMQVAMNLIGNAIEAVSPNTGVVTVSTRFHAEEGIADFEVTDNGLGIEQDKIEEMFEPFKSTKGQGGTGLGLPVARKIVREHHGRIVVYSRPDEGTTFRVRLPAQETLRASGETYSSLD